MNLLLLFLSSLSFLCGLEAGKEEDGKEGQRQLSIGSSMDLEQPSHFEASTSLLKTAC